MIFKNYYPIIQNVNQILQKRGRYLKILLVLIIMILITITLFNDFLIKFIIDEPVLNGKQTTNLILGKQSQEPVIPENNLWNLVQAWRLKQGLELYQKSDPVCSFAQTRGEKVIGNLLGNENPHLGFDEDLKEFFDYFCQGNCMGAENVAWDYSSEQNALDNWLYSESHLKNLTADYTYSCLIDYGNTAIQVFMNY